MHQSIVTQRTPARLLSRARWLPMLAGVAGWLASAGPALGQENPPAPPGVIVPPSSGATPQPGRAGAPTTGVIHPPARIDPGIKAKPPVPPAQLPTPVIPPPGTPGGDQSVQPR